MRAWWTEFISNPYVENYTKVVLVKLYDRENALVAADSSTTGSFLVFITQSI